VASVAERFGRRGVQVVGVQSPEFEQEKDIDLVRAAVKRFGVTWPIYVDNDEKMWDALGTEAWPSLYVVDRKGGIRLSHVGEIHAGDDDAKRIESLLDTLLREPAPAGARPESG
jgi:alkyl hydroperoxide reductase subunit AhpC